VPQIGKVVSWSRLGQAILQRTSGMWPVLALVAVTALVISIIRLQPAVPETGGGAAPSGNWQAVAPGRVEPLSSEIKITPVIVAPVSEVLVKVNDTVIAGEPLIRMKDDELRARLAVAEAQVLLRRRLRDEQRVAGKAADRRKAEDALSEAEADVFDARSTLDAAAAARRTSGGSSAQINAARATLSRAQDAFRARADALRSIQEGSPLPTQSETQLSIARAERSVARAALDKMTIRAPISGTVLQVNVKVGETAMPTSTQPLLLIGDISALRVRVELDDRDVGSVRVGQPVVVRANAFPERDITGKVASVAPIVGPASGIARGSRSPVDVNVAEVLVDLTNPGPLTSGMQVDVYFRRIER